MYKIEILQERLRVGEAPELVKSNSENMNSKTGATSMTFMRFPVTSAMGTNKSSPFCEQMGLPLIK